jgi:hypothetical protein
VWKIDCVRLSVRLGHLSHVCLGTRHKWPISNERTCSASSSIITLHHALSGNAIILVTVKMKITVCIFMKSYVVHYTPYKAEMPPAPPRGYCATYPIHNHPHRIRGHHCQMTRVEASRLRQSQWRVPRRLHLVIQRRANSVLKPLCAFTTMTNTSFDGRTLSHPSEASQNLTRFARACVEYIA